MIEVNKKEDDSMNLKLIGIIVILMGIWQIYVAQKMYQNIQRHVKNPGMSVFYGVFIAMILGIVFLIVGVTLIR